MCPNFTIGANESRLGIVVPAFFQAAIRNTISRRQAETALTLGTMFTTAEALQVWNIRKLAWLRFIPITFAQIGLVDELAIDKADAVTKCEKFLMEFKKVVPQAHYLTKQMLRKNEITTLIDNRKQDLDLFVSTVNQPNVQEILKLYMQNLKRKSKLWEIKVPFFFGLGFF